MRKLGLLLIAIMVFSLLGAGMVACSDEPEETKVLRLAVPWPPGDPVTVNIEEFIAAFNEKADGKYVIELHTGESLVKIGDSMDAVRTGAVEMVGFAVGGVLMGRLADRFGITIPMILGAVFLGIGYVAASQAAGYWQFVVIQAVLIGMLGSSATFGPLVADVSFWFRRRRGIAVAIAASGNRSRLLATIKTPTLVIHGADDPLVPLPAGRDTARCIQGARLEVIDGMGHNLPTQLIPRMVDLITGHAKGEIAAAA